MAPAAPLVFPAFPLVPPPPELAVPEPGEPHAATSAAAAARKQNAMPRLSTRRGAWPASDEPQPGVAGLYVPAMTMVLLVITEL